MSTMLQTCAQEESQVHPTRRPIRVLYFDHTALLSGGELALLETIRNLDRSAVEPIVLLGEHGPLEEALAVEAPTHVLEIAPEIRNTRKDTLSGLRLNHARRITQSMSYIRTLVDFIRQVNPDVIHTNSLKSDILGGLAARLTRVPVVWHVRDRISPDYLPRITVSVFRRLARWIPDYVVGCSQSVIDTLDLPDSKPRAVVYSGIDLQHYETSARAPRARAATRQTVIGLVGRLGPWKGQHVFIEAAAKAHQQFPETRFLLYGSAMFGEKDYEQSLRRMVQDLSLEGVVEFRGFERNIAAAILDLDILVHASITPEPFGQVIVQGMAATKPVIASEGGGASEIIRPGIDGLLVQRGNSVALAEAMCRLLRDPVAAQRMAVQGKERVRGKFTIDVTVNTMTRVFREMLQNKPRLGRRDKPL